MLVLNRSPDEIIHIGDDITIKVLCIYGQQVGLGIDAPKAIKIWRKEIYDQIKAEEKVRENYERLYDTQATD